MVDFTKVTPIKAIVDLMKKIKRTIIKLFTEKQFKEKNYKK